MIKNLFDSIKDISRTKQIDFGTIINSGSYYSSKFGNSGSISYIEKRRLVRGIKEFEQLYHQQQKCKCKNIN